MSDANCAYGFKKTVDHPVRGGRRPRAEALQEEGFGVLTEIDVKATMKKKLDVDFRPYRILGACNPPLAHQALARRRTSACCCPATWSSTRATSPETSVVAILDPVLQLGVAGREDMRPLAEEVRDRMTRVLAAICGVSAGIAEDPERVGEDDQRDQDHARDAPQEALRSSRLPGPMALTALASSCPRPGGWTRALRGS